MLAMLAYSRVLALLGMGRIWRECGLSAASFHLSFLPLALATR